MRKINLFVSPESWFSFVLPMGWIEQDFNGLTFLFNNPYKWDGNFRISAYRGDSCFAKQVLNDEQRANRNYIRKEYNAIPFLYMSETFTEGEDEYINHFWIGGIGDTIVECSFSSLPEQNLENAEAVLNSLVLNPNNGKEAMIIPVRLSEIYAINSSYENIEKSIKEKYSKDFSGVENDIASMQLLLDEAPDGKKGKSIAIDLGVTLACIIVGEVNEYEWCTLIDGNRESPVLHEINGENIIDPMKLVWSSKKAGIKVDLQDVYEKMLNR